MEISKAEDKVAFLKNHLITSNITVDALVEANNKALTAIKAVASHAEYDTSVCPRVVVFLQETSALSAMHAMQNYPELSGFEQMKFIQISLIDACRWIGSNMQCKPETLEVVLMQKPVHPVAENDKSICYKKQMRQRYQEMKDDALLKMWFVMKHIFNCQSSFNQFKQDYSSKEQQSVQKEKGNK